MSQPALSVDVRAEALLARLSGAAEQLRANVTRVITRGSLTVQARVKEQKLTGQVLSVRTGTLRRSINRRIEAGPDGIFATVGTNVRYAAIHEYGFNGTSNVKAHTRKITQAFGKPLREAALQNVRAHSRKVNMPARPFLRPALQEEWPAIRENLRQAALDAVGAR